MFKLIRKTIILFCLAALPNIAIAQQKAGKHEYPGLNTAEIDQLVTRAMETFKVPGIAVGIIKDGKVIHAKGYGIREVGKKGRIDEQTLFSIASTGKSFTAAALALLVDDGKITWEDKVINHIPAFQLYDPWVTREFTIKDLLIHNSGLGKGAGDLMFWPTSGFSRQEIIENLRHLKPVSSFRSEYAYDNLLYVVAGEIIAAVSGLSFEDFVDQRILQPLNMEHCATNRSRLKGHKNIAVPHMIMDGKLQTVSRLSKVFEPAVTAAAGGMQCSIQSILKWHDMHLNKGRLPGGEALLSEKQQTNIMTPQTIMAISPNRKEWFGTNFSAYGLGWRISDMHGFKVEQHAGGLLGMLSLNAMVPELGLGVAIYTNQQAGSARPAIMYQILEAYLTDQKTDWISRLDELKKKRIAEAAKLIPDMTTDSYVPAGSIDRYAGVYSDPWFGNVEISHSQEGLYFKSVRSARLKGKMTPYKADIFIVRWEDRTLEADAYVKFSIDYDGKPEGITMKAVSPLTDFSFNFHDLDFKRNE